MRIASVLMIVIAAAVFLVPGSAGASEVWPSGPDRRVLGGHRFQPTGSVRDPFVTTHLQTLTGGGLATGLESPFLNVDGDTLGVLEGDLGFFRLDFEYQLNLFDRASLMVSLSGTGRSGVDNQSMLADGLTTIYGLVIEGKGVVWRDERTQLSGIARFNRKNLFGIDPFAFAQRVIEEGGLTEDNRLVQEGDINRGALGLSAAHGYRPWLGFTGFVLAGSAQPVLDERDRETFVQTGIAASFDLKPLRGFPIGFALGYGFDSFPEGGSDVAKGIHSGTLGINYTGREDFHCGAEVSVATLKQTDIENTYAATTFVMSLRYYF